MGTEGLNVNYKHRLQGGTSGEAIFINSNVIFTELPVSFTEGKARGDDDAWLSYLQVTRRLGPTSRDFCLTFNNSGPSNLSYCHIDSVLPTLWKL